MNTVVAKAYWRSIQRGTRKFEDVPPEMQPLVKELADQDLHSGAITQELYNSIFGVSEEDEAEAE